MVIALMVVIPCAPSGDDSDGGDGSNSGGDEIGDGDGEGGDGGGGEALVEAAVQRLELLVLLLGEGFWSEGRVRRHHAGSELFTPLPLLKLCY